LWFSPTFWRCAWPLPAALAAWCPNGCKREHERIKHTGNYVIAGDHVKIKSHIQQHTSAANKRRVAGTRPRLRRDKRSISGPDIAVKSDGADFFFEKKCFVFIVSVPVSYHSFVIPLGHVV
jgi:hypothetical protein